MQTHLKLYFHYYYYSYSYQISFSISVGCYHRQVSHPDLWRLFVTYRAFTFGTECIRSKQTQLGVVFSFFLVLFCFWVRKTTRNGLWSCWGTFSAGDENSGNCGETLSVSVDVLNSQETNGSLWWQIKAHCSCAFRCIKDVAVQDALGNKREGDNSWQKRSKEWRRKIKKKQPKPSQISIGDY